MSDALVPTSPAAFVPERFANPLKQLQGFLAQPAVRRSLPMALMVGLIAAAALAWMALSTPPQKTLFAGLGDADKASVTSALSTADITSHIDDGTGAVTVAEDDYARARMLLAGQGLPKAAPGGYAILDQLPMGVSRAVEGERLRQARESELAQSIQEIDAVAEARVHLAMPESSVFVRDNASPSASVVLKLQTGRALSDAQVSSIVNLVASSVPGMKPDAVTIVDQAGTLLSKQADGADDGSDQRLAYQHRLEDKFRDQLQQLLTPLVGDGNFTTEVQADVDLDETQATRESYDKQGALRAEQGQWTGNQAANPQAPGGIPGALSNTPPAASTLQQPKAATGVSGQPATPGQPAAGAAAPDPMKQSDQFARAYDLGKEVSVSRSTPGGVKRLTVAVLLRDAGAKPRSPAEIQQITSLVQAAVGFNQGRGDVVTVISRKFADTAADLDGKQPFYESGWFAMVTRNVTAIVIALLVLLLGVRPLAKGLMKKKDEASRDRPALARAMGSPAGEPLIGADGRPMLAGDGKPVSIDELARTTGYDDRVAMVRGFTRDNPSRAALAVRDMIKAPAK